MDKKQIRSVLEKRKAVHVEDPCVYKYWDELTRLLSMDAKKTIKFLNECSEDDIGWISEVFEDVAYKLQSNQFIECLDFLYTKYPNIPMEDSIKTAKSYML
ncbi:hypothetical protein [Oceanirhabdus sp. W0125-5]|uniref:hypothetical protein n=1 Tax=Oceanirhabdus sp. W0125-5 TaxID=2999116 RepID=UPI0022F2F10B|nr:hypothetical protein [Oceanirhabdus sp. W0125-5]WBW96076.1 hypothetical protein OW730_20630 [Oceanirhabdus sp. W0125-5]